MKLEKAYPLQWPLGFPRTKDGMEVRARFKVSFGVARDSLIHELRTMKAERVILSSNVPLRMDGLPYAKHGRIFDHGAAVYFFYKGEQRVLACDKWDDVKDNVRALALTVAAMRALERYGVSEMLDRTFNGFAALPEHTGGPSPDWTDVLGVDANVSKEDLRRAYRSLAAKHHPDKGGSHDRMVQINVAYTHANEELGYD